MLNPSFLKIAALVSASLVFSLLASGCSREDSSARDGYHVEITDVAMEKTLELEYESTEETTQTYLVTGKVGLFRDDQPSAESGELILSMEETTGFEDKADATRSLFIPVLKGQGAFRAVILNLDIPAAKKSGPPQLNYRFANFDRYEEVAACTDESTAADGVRLEAKPISVVVDDEEHSYIATEELIATGCGSLSRESFSLFVLRTTLEHSSPWYVANTVVYRIPVNEGKGRNYETEVLALVDKNEDGEPNITPIVAPKYKYDVMGIRRESNAEVRVR